MPKVIVLDNLAQEGLDLLKAAPEIEHEVRTGLKGDDLKKALTEFDGAICRSGVKLTDDVLAGNRRLKAIVRAGVGTDNIDKPAATRQGIVVMNTPTGNTLSTAEHAFTLMMALSRNVAPAFMSLRAGKWDRKKFNGSQIADKTLGVVGLGRIGQEVAARAAAFGMRVLGYDPFLSAERAQQLGIEPYTEVREMLPHVDYLTVHTPLTPETKGLISHAEIEIMRPGVRLINCARGGIYDEQALVEGLKSGKIGGVALDVYENEPCTDSPLFQMDNVLCTPHLGASTEEAQTQVAIEAVNLLTNYLTTGEIRHSVNVAAIDPTTLASLQGFIDVSYRLGLLLAQWHSGKIESCRITFRGDVAEKETKVLISAFCAGLVSHASEDVNIINAQVLLRERGIEVVAENRSGGTFKSSVTAEVKTDRHKYVAAGTLFGNDMPRLVRLEDYRLEAYLDGILFMFTHDDVPGIIGTVGTTFGQHQVNIGQMSVGRSAPGKDAIGVLNLDSPPSDAAVEAVLAHEGIHRATTIQLPAPGELPPWISG